MLIGLIRKRYNMTEKPKRKHNSRVLFKLKLLLLAFIVTTWIALSYPLVWLAPPLFRFTPFVYIGLSLLWIPIVWRVLRFVTSDKIVKALMIACIASTVVMSSVFANNVTSEADCWRNENDSTQSIRCYTKGGVCGSPTYDYVLFDTLLITDDYPWYTSGVYIYCTF